MKKYILLLAVLLSVANIHSFAQDQHHFERSETIMFPNGQSQMVSYITFPERHTWGWIDVTITGGYNMVVTGGVLTKRIALVNNIASDGGYYSFNEEITSALGPIADQWHIGAYDPSTRRIPIYHLNEHGSQMNIKVEGQLVNKSAAIDFQNLITFGTPVVVPNDKKRQYKYMTDNFIGIGTETPKERLSVNGKIRAHEIKVETANWPDYVFEEDYKVRSLAELGAFIKENKHLPEMPTAKDVEKEGLELGEMNKKLLKKIEELTLYILEMKKDIEVQKEEINHLKTRKND